MYTVTVVIENDRHVSYYNDLEQALTLKAFAVKHGLSYSIAWINKVGGGYIV